MKKMIILIALLGTVLLTGCNQQSSSDITNSTDASSVNIQTTETETEVSTVKPTEKGTEAPTEDLSMYPTMLDNVDMKEVTSNLLTWCKENFFTEEMGYSDVSLCKEYLAYDKNNVKYNAYGIIVQVKYDKENRYYFVDSDAEPTMYGYRSYPGTTVCLESGKLAWFNTENYMSPEYTKGYTARNMGADEDMDFYSLESVMETVKHHRDSYIEASGDYPSQDFEVIFADKIDL